MRSRDTAIIAGVASLGLALFVLTTPALSEPGGPSDSTAKPASAPLAGPASFAKIRNKTRRSQALFTEASKVLTHQRCVNCHPDGDRPLQGEDGRLHEPPVQRGPTGLGVTGMRCTTCHQTENFDPGRVPGAANWHLAPRTMAWQGKTPAEICAQLKDPKRNGNRTLADIARHMAEDHLVGWAWTPGVDRAPPPGDQKTFGELMQAWVDTGAACPK